MDKETILKVLVGSQAHGLADANSDYDYRGVYVVPTKQILSLGYNYKGSHWLEGEKEDQTAYEIGHFLQLATKCNPSILEVMVGPMVIENKRLLNRYEQLGQELRALFPYCWNPQDAFNAFCGYSHNQQKKMLDNHLDRWHKYGSAYLRVLANLCDLLETGIFSLEIKDPVLKINLIAIRKKEYSIGQIVDLTSQYKKRAERLLGICTHKPDLGKVNEFLLKIRQEFWE